MNMIISEPNRVNKAELEADIRFFKRVMATDEFAGACVSLVGCEMAAVLIACFNSVLVLMMAEIAMFIAMISMLVYEDIWGTQESRKETFLAVIFLAASMVSCISGYVNGAEIRQFFGKLVDMEAYDFVSGVVKVVTLLINVMVLRAMMMLVTKSTTE